MFYISFIPFLVLIKMKYTYLLILDELVTTILLLYNFILFFYFFIFIYFIYFII